MIFTSLTALLKVVLILLSTQSVESVSKRRLKKPEKPEEPMPHLSISFEELRAKMTVFGYSDFAQVATGHRRILTLFISQKDPEGLRAFRGFYGAYLRLQRKELNITWGYVDCDVHIQLCADQKIHYSPQYWLYINKRRVNYTAGRSAYLLSDWVYKSIAYPGLFIDNRKQLKKYEQQEDRFFFYIGYMDEDYEMFKEMATSIPYYTWISCFDRDRMMTANGVYWYDNPHRAQDMRNGPFGNKVLQNFTLKYFNILRNAPDWTMDRIFMHDQAAVILFYPDTNEERGVQMTFWPAAMDFKWEILCVQLPIHLNNSNVVHLMEYLGVTNPESSAMRIVRLNSQGKWDIYQMRDRLSTEPMKNFYKDFKDGKLKVLEKSGKPVEHSSNQPGVVVSKNFKKYVLRPDIDALVIFHYGNCTVCDRLLKLAKLSVHILSRYEDLKVFTMDTKINSGEYIPHTNEPMILLFKKDNKRQPFHFKDLYTAKDLIAWVCKEVGKKNPYQEEVEERLKKRQKKAEAENANPDI